MHNKIHHQNEREITDSLRASPESYTDIPATAESSFYQDGDDQSLVEDAPDVVPEEDAPHQEDDTEDRHGDDNGDEDEVNHGVVEHGDDEDDHDDDEDDHDDDDQDDQPTLTTTATHPIPAPRRSTRVKSKPAWTKDFVMSSQTVPEWMQRVKVMKELIDKGSFSGLDSSVYQTALVNIVSSTH